MSKVTANKTATRVDSLEDMPENSYGKQTGTMFNVRQGPDYASNHLKAKSEESLLSFTGVDVFKTEKKQKDIMQFIDYSGEDFPKLVRSGDFYCPNVIVLNIMCPMYNPGSGLWGTPVYDGESISFVVYISITQEIYDRMADPNETDSSIKLLKTFLQADPSNEEDYNTRGRLKAIPIVANTDEVSFGITMRPLVYKYNSKPFLTGPKYHSFVKKEDYLEVDVDIHNYIILARKTFYNLRDEIQNMVIDFGIVVEARNDEEMPERMLAAGRVCKLNIKDAKTLG